MIIREARVDDAEQISRLVYTLTEKYIANEFDSSAAKRLLNSMRVESILAYLNSDARYHVALINQTVIATVGLRANRHVYHLYVDENYQHQGIARQLWHVARDVSLANGNPGVFTVNSSNYAIPVYRKFGFVPQSCAKQRNGVVSTPMILDIHNKLNCIEAVQK